MQTVETPIGEIRNARRSSATRIECEFQHPEYGWIPFSADKDDPDPNGSAVYEAILKAGPLPMPPKPTKLDTRLTAFASRTAVCEGLFRAGIIDKDQALQGMAGQWPTIFDVLLEDMPDHQQFDVQLYWRQNDVFSRMDSLLLQMIAAMNAAPDLPDLSPGQLDVIFGVT